MAARDEVIEAEADRALAPYRGLLPAEALEDMREVLIEALTVHPVLSAYMERARPRVSTELQERRGRGPRGRDASPCRGGRRRGAGRESPPMTDDTPPPNPLTEDQRRYVAQGKAMVERIANRIAPRYDGLLTKDELLSNGHHGLVRAAQAFDKDLGTPFTSFACGYVTGAIANAVKAEAKHRRRYQRGVVTAAYEVLEMAVEEQGDIMTDTDWDDARRLRTLSDSVADAMAANVIGQCIRGGAPRDEEAFAAGQRERAAAGLRDALQSLTTRERQVAHMHYLDGMDLKDVAKALGMSYATTRRSHAACIPSSARSSARRADIRSFAPRSASSGSGSGCLSAAPRACGSVSDACRPTGTRPTSDFRSRGSVGPRR